MTNKFTNRQRNVRKPPVCHKASGIKLAFPDEPFEQPLQCSLSWRFLVGTLPPPTVTGLVDLVLVGPGVWHGSTPDGPSVLTIVLELVLPGPRLHATITYLRNGFPLASHEIFDIEVSSLEPLSTPLVTLDPPDPTRQILLQICG